MLKEENENVGLFDLHECRLLLYYMKFGRRKPVIDDLCNAVRHLT